MNPRPVEAEQDLQSDGGPPAEVQLEDPIWLDELTPRQIVQELDKYIVGQEEAKKSVAIALRNRWRRQKVSDDLRDEIIPGNLILIGPTGVGKTEIARRLARLAGAPFVKVEASKFTEVGYVGRDVESMIRDLVDIAVNMVRAEREEDVADEAEQRVEERLLDLLLPPGGENEGAETPSEEGTKTPQIFVAGPQGVESTDPESLASRRRRTREKLRKLLQEGNLEDREVEVEISQQASLEGMMVPVGGMEGMDHNFVEMLQDMLPKKTKRRQVSVAEARR
jgi:ATP-dependent HslUV protease ATP-binding subunit HslU